MIPVAALVSLVSAVPKKAWLYVVLAAMVAAVALYVAGLRGSLASARADVAVREARIAELSAAVGQRDTALHLIRASQNRTLAAVRGLRGQASALQAALAQCTSASARAAHIYKKAREVPHESIRTPGGVVDADSSAHAVDLLNDLFAGLRGQTTADPGAGGAAGGRATGGALSRPGGAGDAGAQPDATRGQPG
ncbi:MAG: hypothetical protein PWQ57_894 [Desulfovibrionales bacterium]|jgi:hypothetical protein|nr:hypothetical protein [Desulfovibrionales bacterium]